MPSESQGTKKKKKVKTSVMFFDCLGLKHAENFNGGYKKSTFLFTSIVNLKHMQKKLSKKCIFFI